MDPVVDLAPGAEHEPLARTLADAVEAAVRVPERRRDFERLRGTVGIVLDDTASALTLRFDFGRLTIHEGLVGVPTVTVRGDRDNIQALTRLSLFGKKATPNTRGERRAQLRRIAAAWAGRRLKIYGLLSHPRFVLRFLAALSPPAQ
ncbi:MAG TPA: hypothetical protein PKD61_34955 [Polyangiaceae bacterium]|nr:hypothetical protein [Polyangiaceae bacterium]